MHTLPIQIDPASVPILRSCGLTLCLAKGIIVSGRSWESNPNVVFSSIPPNKLGENVEFRWRDEWRVGEIRDLWHLNKVEPPYSGYRPAKIGQTITLSDHDSDDTPNTTCPSPPPSDSFKVSYPYPNTHSHYLYSRTRVLVELYDALHSQFSPILVSPEINRGETIEFTPDDRCWVWFDGLLEGGRMYKRGKTQRWPFEVDLSLGRGVRYVDGVWGYA